MGLFLFGFASLFGSELRAISSIKELSPGVYYLEYKGDYGFDEFLEKGGAESDSEMASYIISFLSKGFYKGSAEEGSVDYGCTALSRGDYFGRNFDWDFGDAMIVYAEPENGYRSYSTVCVEFLGFGEYWKPEGMANKFMALAGVYVPLDGINEKGLCIADLVVGNSAETNQKTDKPDLTTVGGIRLVLDKAATVDEAIALLSQYDMHSSIGTNHHYAISDRSGRSVAVEWVDGTMVVTETPIVTNHIVAPGLGEGTGKEESWRRFGMLSERIETMEGTKESVKDAMTAASYSDETLWTIVYDKEKCSLDYYFRSDFSSPMSFSIN